MKVQGARSDGFLPFDTLRLERDDAASLSRQLYRQLRDLVLSRALPAHARLPSSRVLAKELGVSRNTVTSALGQLETEGYIVMAERSCSVVTALPDIAVTASPVADQALSRRGRMMTEHQLHASSAPGKPSLHPGVPDIREFPFAKWRKLLQRRLVFGAEDIYAQHYVDGHPALREATASYLNVSRGVRCRPEEIVITSGGQAAFDVIARLMLDPGDHVWLEEPGFYGARSAFEAAGARITPLIVDDTGWRLKAPVGRAPRLIYVTPQCQSPTGATMRLDQRLSLLKLASRLDAWIIEDDFDGEYRFDGRPVPALHQNDEGGRTIYVGTFSKVLFPALRIGYLVVPQTIAERFLRALFLTGQTPPLMMQAVLADFIVAGHFTRHLRRTRRLYAERRRSFARLCTEMIGDFVQVVPNDAGMQTLCLLKKGLNDIEIADRAREKGLSMTPLSRYYGAAKGPSGLILGYAALDERETRRELGALKRILTACSRS